MAASTQSFLVKKPLPQSNGVYWTIFEPFSRTIRRGNDGLRVSARVSVEGDTLAHHSASSLQRFTLARVVARPPTSLRFVPPPEYLRRHSARLSPRPAL